MAEASPNRLLIALFLVSLVMPFYFFLGSLRLSMYRVYLLVFMFTFVIRWLNGSAGRIRLPDILVILTCLWMMGALFINHGVAARFQFAGILVIETAVPYFAARVLIRNLASFRTFVWWYFAIIAALLPFAIFENLTGSPILLDLFSGIFPVYSDVQQEPRLGLERAQATMPHPILFGIFCSPVFALAWYTLAPDRALFKQTRKSSVVGAAVFASLSSGAILGVMLQAGLIAWDEVLRRIKAIKNRWKLFGILFTLLYIVLELSSNRNAFQIIASELSFSASSAWNRIHIFNNAIDDIYANPITGVGLGYWSRPLWMKSSVDNFWLLVALRYGIPAWFALTLAVVVVCWKAIVAPLSGEHARVRRGYVIGFAGMAISAFTVHMWDSTYCAFMFLMGAGVWFFDPECTQENENETAEPKSARRQIRYTRFPKALAEAAQ
ncbi:O-antigen ligase family protein [Ruegeria sp. HKCCA5763]|uniref:O-antigen ligase family protein n=1 Tax=Ruegeria sp. HKCCA5763 TaxID=2682987 RepID=UPI00148977C3